MKKNLQEWEKNGKQEQTLWEWVLEEILSKSWSKGISSTEERYVNFIK